jgi:dienelactone hydrolase
MSSEIVLLHHGQGLTPGVTWFADRLRDAGHTVHTPDYYDGKTFDTLDEGVAYRDELGYEEIARRAQHAVEGLPDELVYAGFSLGVAGAQLLAQTRPVAKGAIFMHGVLPLDAFGAPWPQGLPLQIHTMDRDPWVEQAEATAFADAAQGELFTYPGTGHLFADPNLEDYDEQATELMIGRITAFLGRL